MQKGVKCPFCAPVKTLPRSYKSTAYTKYYIAVRLLESMGPGSDAMKSNRQLNRLLPHILKHFDCFNTHEVKHIHDI